MDLDPRKFGRGPRELGGSVDLLDHYKLRKHLDFFCKRSLPLSVCETQYLKNVVGNTEIRKGEGMELDQLSKNSNYVGQRRVPLRPFGLDLLRDAFQLREATSSVLPLAKFALPTSALNLQKEYKEKKHKKHKNKDRSKKQDHSSCVDKDIRPSKDNNKEKNGSRTRNFGPDLSLLQQVKVTLNSGFKSDIGGTYMYEKPRTESNGGFSGIQAFRKMS